MILIYAILFILIQPVVEAVQNNYRPEWSPVVRKLNIPVRIIIGVTWFLTCTSPTIYYVPTGKLIAGYVFVLFMIYDTIWNITSKILGKKISLWYYGDTKWYDQVMTELGSFGWFLKLFVFGPMGVIFLLGWS